MPDDLTLIGQVWVFTFAFQVALVGACIGRPLHRIHGLLKYIVDELIVCKMQLVEQRILRSRRLAAGMAGS